MHASRKWRAVAAGTVALGAVAAFGAAGASAGIGGGTGPYSNVGTVKGTHGVKVTVFGSNGAGSSLVTIYARKGRRTADYSVDGTATVTKLKADFGARGKVDLKFHGKGAYHKRKLGRHCHGTRDKVQKGTWKGTLKFKGEGAYTKVTAHSISGTRVKPGNYTCNGNGGGGKTVILTVNGADTNFSTSRPASGKGKAYAGASTFGTTDGVQIYRSNTGRSKKKSAFNFNDALTSAQAHPGGLFSGSTEYTADLNKGGGNGFTFGTVSGSIKTKFLGMSHAKTVVQSGASASMSKSEPIRP